MGSSLVVDSGQILSTCLAFLHPKLILLFYFQVPPDWYLPDIDEDDLNPDVRIDRMYIVLILSTILWSFVF